MTGFAHISDLHIGLSAAADRAAEDLCQTLLEETAGPVLLTGDVTHRGRRAELARCEEIFAPLLRTHRLVAVPGNHDRLGDDVRDLLMPGARVQAGQHGGLWIVRVDSTGPHNRRWLDGHGLLHVADLDEVEAALRRAPPGLASVVMLHHHPLPLPDEHPLEKLVTALGWPNARELSRGARLVDRLRGICDVVLHGHRHVPAEMSPFPHDPRPLRIFSAGSSTLQRSFRSFRSARSPGCWLSVERPAQILAQPMPA